MSISVVVPHYYVQRERNLLMLVHALLAGSVVPDEIIFWANAPIYIKLPDEVSVIQSHRNVGAQARFIAALTAGGDYVVFHDNDVAVGRGTIKDLLGWSEKMPASIISIDGRNFNGPDKRYTSTTLVQSPTRPMRVDISLGHLEMVRRTDVPRILATFPFGKEARMDDLQWSAAAARAGVPIFAVPADAVTALSMGGVGSCKEPDHYRERDRLCQTIFGEVATA